MSALIYKNKKTALVENEFGIFSYRTIKKCVCVLKWTANMNAARQPPFTYIHFKHMDVVCALAPSFRLLVFLGATFSKNERQRHILAKATITTNENGSKHMHLRKNRINSLELNRYIFKKTQLKTPKTPSMNSLRMNNICDWRSPTHMSRISILSNWSHILYIYI